MKYRNLKRMQPGGSPQQFIQDMNDELNVADYDIDFMMNNQPFLNFVKSKQVAQKDNIPATGVYDSRGTYMGMRHSGNDGTMEMDPNYKPYVAPNPFPYNPLPVMQALAAGIGTGMENNRQNRYIQQQLASMGRPEYSDSEMYQPNPYSLYAKYGGSLKRYMQQGGSIVDYLKEIGLSSDYKSRARLADMLGVKGYRGSAEQNLHILNMIRKNPELLTYYGQAKSGYTMDQQYPPDNQQVNPLAPGNNDMFHIINTITGRKPQSSYPQLPVNESGYLPSVGSAGNIPFRNINYRTGGLIHMQDGGENLSDLQKLMYATADNSNPEVDFKQQLPTSAPQNVNQLVSPQQTMYSNYNGPSIVDMLKSKGMGYDMNTRRAMAEAAGITNYTGSYDQNIALMNILRGKNPEEVVSSIPAPRRNHVKRQIQQQQQSRVPSRTPFTGGRESYPNTTNIPVPAPVNPANPKKFDEMDERKRARETKLKVNSGDENATFTFPNGKTKKWKDMNWREKYYVSGKNLGYSRANNWTDYINPATWAEDIGTAGYEAQQNNSIMPYLQSVIAPLLAGAGSLRLVGKAKYLPMPKGLPPSTGKVVKQLVNGVKQLPNSSTTTPKGWFIENLGVRSPGYPMFKKGGNYRGKSGNLTPNKAREILHDGTVHDKPITEKQRRYFGAMSKGHTNFK